jgi:hypothetical protein
MVTTRAAKKKSGAELDYDDGDNHGMYLEDLFDDETNHGLSLQEIQARAIEQALIQCANPSGALAKACIESILNPPPPFESEDDEVDHDAHDYRDKVTDHPYNDNDQPVSSSRGWDLKNQLARIPRDQHQTGGCCRHPQRRSSPVRWGHHLYHLHSNCYPHRRRRRQRHYRF